MLFSRKQRSVALLAVTAVALFATLLTFTGQNRAAAQDATKVDETTLTEAMRAFLNNTSGPIDAEALGATPCTAGMAGIYPCNNVDLLAFMPLGAMGGGSGNDSWGWEDPQTGTEYAIMGRSNGTAFVDISDPVNPVYIGNLPSHTGNSSTWRDMKVYDDHVFVVADGNAGHGIQVFDLNQLRTVVAPPVTFANTAHYNGVSSAHNIAINEATGYAYIVGASTCSGGLTFIDISNPLVPTAAGCFSSDGYTHDVQCANYVGPDPDHAGAEICLASNEDTLTIVDVSNKAAPVQIARMGYSGSGYTHQGWLTEDHRYFLQDDELDESNFGHNTRTRVWDVSDLDSPVIVEVYDGPVGAIDHNLYLLNDYAYEANYRSGLRILDASDPTNLVEAAFFDTYPASDTAGFDGAWNVYPFFDSGVVIVSDINSGLFILQPALTPDFAMTATETDLSVCGDGSDMTTLNLLDRNGYTGSVTLSTVGLPGGASGVFSTNPVAVPGSSDLTVSTSGVAPGDYPFTVEGTDGPLTHEVAMSLNVAPAAPVAPTLVSPPNGAAGQPPRPTFTWNATPGAVTYDIQIATDAAFNNVVVSATGLADTMYTPAGSLPSGDTLYWRVRANNGCGTGPYSAPFNFDTLLCSAPALAIPDNDPTGVTDEIVLPNMGNVTDLDVSVNAQHTWVGDLIFTLEHVETGTSVTFYDRPGVPASTFGCSGNDIDATLDDEAATPVENECGAGTPAIDGTFIPNNPLAAFDGEASTGTWRLTASDAAGGDTGTLNEWCLLVVPDAPPPMPSIALTKTVSLDGSCGATSGPLQTSWGNDVTYCYTVENTGNVTFTTHTLTDTVEGVLLQDVPVTLAPGATFAHTTTVTLAAPPPPFPALLTNCATWEAADPTGAHIVQSNESCAQVEIFAPTDVTLTGLDVAPPTTLWVVWLTTLGTAVLAAGYVILRRRSA